MQLQVDIFIIYEAFVFNNKQRVDWVLIFAFFLRPDFVFILNLLRLCFNWWPLILKSRIQIQLHLFTVSNIINNDNNKKKINLYSVEIQS